MSGKTHIGVGNETISDAGTTDTVIASSQSGRASAPTVGSASAEPGTPKRGDSIGRFVVLGVLGEGGMGVVYSAYDPHLDRKVAIKLLRTAPELDGIDARSRLLREAQAMAKINQVNVIKVHEAGTFNDQVYVAMEFADGGTVRDWLKTPRSRREILDVFVAAGRGLAAAHAVGLVHRDFKPDNVLLGKDGSVRVTDFGLVAATTPEDAAAPPPTQRPISDVSDISLSDSTPLSQNLTRTGAIMGTPTYMAPEQFNGVLATARTDQFAFGIALYEAVYGVRPFAGTSYAELAANVTQGELVPPPRATKVPSWIRRVLVRALARDQADRYPSMIELLAALERDPARPRRRVLAALGVGAIVAGVAWFAIHPASGNECDAGDGRVAKAWNPERRSAMKTAFDSSGRPHAAGSFDKASMMLDAWSHDWTLGYVDACKATRVRGDQSEHLLDLRMQCLTRRLEDASSTIELLTAGGGDAIDHALSAVMALPSIETCAHPAALLVEVAPPDNAMIAAQVTGVRARLDEARAQQRLARYAKGLVLAQAALVTARATAYAPAIAEALQLVGTLQIDLGQPASVESLRESTHVAAAAGDSATLLVSTTWLIYALTTQAARYEVAEELAGFADAEARHLHPVPEIAVRLDDAIGLLLATRGHAREAQVRYEQALAQAEKAFGPDHPAVIATLNQLGNLEKSQGRFEDARKVLERVVASRERVFGKDHPDLAGALNNLANVYRVEGKYPDAKRLYDRALAIRSAALGPDHPDVGTSYNNLGTFFADQEDHKAALVSYQKARAIWEKVYGPDSVELAGVYSNIGSELNNLGDSAGARKSYERAIALYEKAHGPDFPDAAAPISNLGLIVEADGHFAEALADFQRAEQIVEKAYGPDHPDVADYLLNSEVALKKLKKLDEAEATMNRALKVLAKAYGPDHPRMAMALTNLGSLQRDRDNPRGALESFQKSLAIFEVKFGKDHIYDSYPLIGIGWAYDELKRSAEAVPLLERAVAIRTAAKITGPELSEAQLELAHALYATHAHARAIALAKTALAGYVAAKDTDDANETKAWLVAHH